MKLKRRSKKIKRVGAIGLILGTILPYVKYNIWGYKISITLWGYWEGKVIMLLAIANLLFIFRDIVDKYIPFLFNSAIGQKIRDCENPKLSLIPTVLSAIVAIYLTSILGIDSFGNYNLGFYAMWIGTISLVGYAFLHRKDDSYNMKM